MTGIPRYVDERALMEGYLRTGSSSFLTANGVYFFSLLLHPIKILSTLRSREREMAAFVKICRSSPDARFRASLHFYNIGAE